MGIQNQRILVFSYNRGPFLQNAIASIVRHFEEPQITVIDDGSTDSETLDILANLRDSVEVLRPPKTTDFDQVTGGLHHGMNFAFDLCEDRGEDLVLVMQDDMQIVRNMDREEILRASSFFDNPSSSFVLAGIFCKNYGGTRNSRMYRSGNFYYRNTDEKKIATTYTDTGIFSIPKLRSTLGKLTKGEGGNQRRAAEMGLRLGFVTMPFMHFLPFPISYRSRSRDWRASLLDSISGAGIHSIEPLTGNRLKLFLERDPDVIPFDEDWLKAPTAPPCRYWSYHGGKANAKARGGWRSALARAL